MSAEAATTVLIAARECARCGEPFAVPDWEPGKTRLYCSELCKRRASAARRRGRQLDDRRLCKCGCGEPVLKHFIRGHSSRLRRVERPPKPERETLEEHFQRFIGPQDENGCLPWIGPISNDQPVFVDSRLASNGKRALSRGANRVAYMLAEGKWPPPDRAVKRACGNRLCVNPDHLRLSREKRPRRSSGHVIILTPGERFGKLVVIRRGENTAKGEARWWCRCDCGNERLVKGPQLVGHTIKRRNGKKTGITLSCNKCDRYEDIAGARFGRLVARDAIRGGDGEIRWACACDCGSSVEVLPQSLVSGQTRSCGCLRRDVHRATRIGDRFGRLVVMEEAGREKGHLRWKCRCDCGNETIALSRRLREGRARSCGCLGVEAALARAEQMRAAVAERQRQREARSIAAAELAETRSIATKNRRIQRWSRRAVVLALPRVTQCLRCGAEISYVGRGRPRKFCVECAPRQGPDLAAALLDRVRVAAAIPDGWTDAEGAAEILNVAPAAIAALARERLIPAEGRRGHERFEIVWLEKNKERLARERLLV